MFRPVHAYAVRFILALSVAILLIAIGAGCGAPSDSAAGGSNSSKKTTHVGPHGVPDGPLTPRARNLTAILADSTGTPVYEATQGLQRIGRDAVPALLEMMVKTQDQAVQGNVAVILAGFGLGAREATKELQRLQVEGSSAVANLASMVLQKMDESAQCGLAGMPQDAELHLVGRYQGDKELDIQLGESGHAVAQIDVVVGRTERPVILVLTAYDPVVWKVGTMTGAKLAGVLVSGYHTQALLGIPASTPHNVITGEESTGCEAFRAIRPEDVPQAAPLVLARTGHTIEEFHGSSPTTYFVIGDAGSSPMADVEYSDDIALDDYQVYRGEIPAGPRGVEELARQGKIRAATQEDLDNWMAGSGESGLRLQPGGAYVVLGQITLPPGLFGAHSRTFIIPAGVPLPAGPKGHCSFLLLDGFSRR